MRAAFLIRCSTKKQDYERQVNDLTRLAKKFGYTSSDNMIFGEHITGKDDASKRDRQSIHFVYLQLIIPQYFISNKSGIWSLSLIVHSKG